MKKKNKFALFYSIQMILYLKYRTLFRYYRNKNYKNIALIAKRIWVPKNRKWIFAIFVEIGFVKSAPIKLTLSKTFRKARYLQLSLMLLYLANKWHQQLLRRYHWDSPLLFIKKMEKYVKFVKLNFWR